MTDDKINELKNQYINGATPEEIMNQFDIKWTELYQLIAPCLYRKLDKVTPEQEEQICALYKQGMSSTKIGYLFQLYHKIVNAILENNGIDRNGNGLRKYSLDEHYFDNIDTPNKAYILGFLYADGYNNEKSGVIGISVQEQDKDVLQKINQELNCNNTLKFSDYNHRKNSNWSNVYRMGYCSRIMSKSLAKHGVVQNKSLKIIFPEHLDTSLYSHFIRGYFDGDGCFYCGRKYDTEVNLVGTEQFCTKVLEILHDYNVIQGGKVCHTGHGDNGATRIIRFGGAQQTKAFLDWIYNDADLYLNRKHQKYIDRYYSNINDSLSA